MKKNLLAAVLALALALGLSPVYAEETDEGAGHAPVAENLTLETFRGVSVGGTLSAVDPDGEPVTFRLTTEPLKGEVTVSENGEFLYTPADGKRGRDYFGYKAVDSSGAESQEATVIIRIRKQKTDVTYADLAGRPEAYAAVTLAERGLCVGECIGGTHLFAPDRGMTRSEFLALCMELTDAELLDGVMNTGFGDDDAIPHWAKPYVSTAVMNGDIHGCSGGDAMVFESERFVTHAEAAVLLDHLLAPTAVSVPVLSAVPAWASQAVANLSSCSVYPPGRAVDAPLTRAEAAVMLVNAIEMLGRR